MPFRILVMGDYTMKADKQAVEQRKPKDINKSNFDAVMQSHNLSLDLAVPDRLAGQGEMPVSLRFGTLKDFRPEAIARQVPQLKSLMDIREAMKALCPGLNNKENVKKLESAIEGSRDAREDPKMVQGSEAAGGEAKPDARPSKSGRAGLGLPFSVGSIGRPRQVGRVSRPDFQ